MAVSKFTATNFSRNIRAELQLGGVNGRSLVVFEVMKSYKTPQRLQISENKYGKASVTFHEENMYFLASILVEDVLYEAKA